jgi:CheY-like chemotaxis protein
VEFISRIDPALPPFLQGDPTRLRQVLLGLLSNAFKFTTAGHVLLDVAVEADENNTVQLYLAVHDTGCGLDDSLKFLMGSMFNESGSVELPRSNDGKGMGLTICNRLVKLMNGRMGVRSHDEGSTFWVRLPMVKAVDPSVLPDRVDDFDNARLLVVDDNPACLKLLSRQLSQWHVSFDVASNAEEALDKLCTAQQENNPYNMAILDYLMPGMDGEALAQSISKNPGLTTPIMIMLTGYSQPKLSKQFKDSGFAAVLTKPASSSLLFDTLITTWSLHQSPSGEINSATSTTADTLLNRQAIREYSRQFYRAEHGAMALARLDKPVKILVAEDNVVNQKVISCLLEKMNTRVDVATNGAEAVKMSGLIQYDLILMDCHMPGMDGYEATRTIRMRLDSTPIVALTANTTMHDRQQCLEAGMDDFMSKPVSFDALQKVLSRWIVQASTEIEAVSDINQQWVNALEQLG